MTRIVKKSIIFNRFLAPSFDFPIKGRLQNDIFFYFQTTITNLPNKKTTAFRNGLPPQTPPIATIPAKKTTGRPKPSGKYHRITQNKTAQPQTIRTVRQGSATRYHSVSNNCGHELPLNRFKASRYFSTVFSTTSAGTRGAGACLFQPLCSSQSRINCLSKDGGLLPT
ncbi:Uncharacterised protein [Neisseria animalis]|nr:Uncharacterised protein [Neisseria animalis]